MNVAIHIEPEQYPDIRSCVEHITNALVAVALLCYLCSLYWNCRRAVEGQGQTERTEACSGEAVASTVTMTNTISRCK